MNYEKETLNHLRKSLVDEDDETSIIHCLENHHRYLKEYCNILIHTDLSVEHKQSTLYLLMHIFKMHAQAEEDIFYSALKKVRNHDLRLEGIRGKDEHEIAFEIIAELEDANATTKWSDEIDAKARVLAGLIASHLREEETVMFPLAEKSLPESKLIDLTDDYLHKCSTYLEMEMLDKLPSDVSRNDVMTFFY